VEPDDGSSQNRHKFIVPMDYNPCDRVDFRGNLQDEISALLRKLTDRTPNVTVIMDCCHAGRMARNQLPDDSAKPRFFNPVPYTDLDARVRAFLADSAPIASYHRPRKR
jgi:hypothetical protein